MMEWQDNYVDIGRLWSVAEDADGSIKIFAIKKTTSPNGVSLYQAEIDYQVNGALVKRTKHKLYGLGELKKIAEENYKGLAK